MILLRFIPLKGQWLDICNRLEVVWFDRSTLGDGLPAIHYFLNCPFTIIFNKQFLNRLTPNAFELPKTFFFKTGNAFIIFF